MNHDTVIIGGRGAGETLAEELANESGEVAFLGDDHRAVERAAAAGADARVVDLKTGTALDREGLDGPDVVIVASHEDGRNLLVAQLVRIRRANRVIALVNDPENVDAFVDAGVEPVCASTALASALDRKRHGEEVFETEESSEDHKWSTNENERLRSDGGGDA
ncbi:NAD-binding protein [Halorarum halophilum]|uniref:NAD-binding protein n=1 Tax=Halorarum halophilum TaxID=2743090 RepID=A0A7D5K2C6_9EURY|nr:NAD-binding protein [Halobaculum halophilum]QLG28741.1 NAD-binding protein [Halobaculum halophilum]